MPKVVINTDKCKGCLLCISVCPKGSLEAQQQLNDKGLKPVKCNAKVACLGCAMCAIICPECCIEVIK